MYLAARDPRMPMVARLLALAVAAYALSPIDLIPDFIPVLGYLDDLLIVPLGLLLVLRLTPEAVLADARASALEIIERPTSKIAAGIFICIWLACLAAFAWWAWPHWR